MRWPPVAAGVGKSNGENVHVHNETLYIYVTEPQA